MPHTPHVNTTKILIPRLTPADTASYHPVLCRNSKCQLITPIFNHTERRRPIPLNTMRYTCRRVRTYSQCPTQPNLIPPKFHTTVNAGSFSFIPPQLCSYFQMPVHKSRVWIIPHVAVPYRLMQSSTGAYNRVLVHNAPHTPFSYHGDLYKRFNLIPN